MPNDVFRAIDAVLVFGVDDPASPEGAAADALVSQYDLSNVVGRLAHVNGALVRLLLGDVATSPPSAANFVQPAFNIVATLKDPARPDNDTRVTVFGARFDSWTYTVPTEDFVMEGVSFQALRLSFEES
jgi:hypothetical protein